MYECVLCGDVQTSCGPCRCCGGVVRFLTPRSYGTTFGEDLVNVVRCKHCKDYRHENDEQIGTCAWYSICIKPSDYCSHGERKGEK